jgi:RimJ/RimL family protein N-acetyltransferase
MMDLANYGESAVLKNGTTVLIRAIRGNDKAKLSEAFRNLETDSIYTRFFHYKKTLTNEELKAATEVDFENVVALVVTTGEGENETIIGGARYVISDETVGLRSAEVAFTVEEDYHGLGIASLLLRHLAAIARQRGISRFEAEVLPENHAMLSVFSRSGFSIRKELREGTVHVTLSIMVQDS